MISIDARDKSLEYLADTDEVVALNKANMVRLDKLEKTIIAEFLLISAQKTDKLKDADARISNAYRQWQQDYSNSVYDYEIIRNKRIHASLVIEVWRSEFSGLKQGIIL